MNRSQHASTDHQPVKSGCQSEITQQVFRSTPLAGSATTTTLSRWATPAPPRGWQPAAPRTLAVSRTPHPRSLSLVLSVSRPRSPRVHRCGPTSPCTSPKIHSIAPASSIQARSPGLEAKRRLTNNSATTASSVSACAPRPRNSLFIRSSFSHLAGEARRRNAMRSWSRRAASISLRLTEHSDSIAMALSLTPSYFGKDPWHCREVSRQHFGKEIVHREELSKRVRFMSADFPRQKFGERSHEETLHQERCARKAAWDFAKIFTSSRIRENYVLSST